jgi:uncharacterized protein YjiS (DUF1127 family)
MLHRSRRTMQVHPSRGLTRRSSTMILTYIFSKVRNYLRYRETVRELSQLSDRELNDLGISRFEIDSIARSHASA